MSIGWAKRSSGLVIPSKPVAGSREMTICHEVLQIGGHDLIALITSMTKHAPVVAG
jgi:hypothetical protein